MRGRAPRGRIVRKGRHAESDPGEPRLDRGDPNSHPFRFTRDFLELDLIYFQEILQHGNRAFVSITFAGKSGVVLIVNFPIIRFRNERERIDHYNIYLIPSVKIQLDFLFQFVKFIGKKGNEGEHLDL